jgi:hypothetical protein
VAIHAGRGLPGWAEPWSEAGTDLKKQSRWHQLSVSLHSEFKLLELGPPPASICELSAGIRVHSAIGRSAHHTPFPRCRPTFRADHGVSCWS